MSFESYLITIFVGFVLIFGAAVLLVRMYTGCTYEEAVKKVQSFVSGRPEVSIANDMGFSKDVADSIRGIIGEKRYKQIIGLERTGIDTPLLFFGRVSRLPIIDISVGYQDDNEKAVLQNVLTNIVLKYLSIYGYSTVIKTEWKVRRDLMMPYLRIMYATNSEERKVLDILLGKEKQTYLLQNNPVLDDTEEDLNE